MADINTRPPFNLKYAKDNTMSTSYPDGKKSIIESIEGNFGGAVTLLGEFSAYQSQHTHWLRGNPSALGTPALPTSTKYVHSNIDSYNGNGASMYAKKNPGTTAIGVDGGGEAVLSFNEPKRSMYVTFMMKIVNQNLNAGAEGPQIKSHRIRNSAKQAISYRTPQFQSANGVTVDSMQDFCWTAQMQGSSGVGPNEAGNDLIGGTWIRSWMYTCASTAPGIMDGAAQIMQKRATTGGFYYNYRETGGANLSVNDGRLLNPTPRMRVANNCCVMPNIIDGRDCFAYDYEWPYYSRSLQEFYVLIDDFRLSETPEGVWAHNLPTLTQSLIAGKVSDIPYYNRTSSVIELNAISVAPFVAGDDIYFTVINSNGVESNAQYWGTL